MKYRNLGASGLKVSEISLGSWLTYGGYVEKQNALLTIQKAYESGINYFDTANCYGQGQAEMVVGEALRAYPRESYALGTKVYFPMGSGPNDCGLSRKHIMAQANASLKRLGMEYIDVLYCHRYDGQTPLEETLRALDDLVAQGKILHFGVSQWTAAQMAEAHAIASRNHLNRVIVNQPIYNMFNRYIEKEVIPICESIGIGQVVYSPLAEGLLTGKYRKGQVFPQDSRAANQHWNEGDLEGKRQTQVELLIKFAEELSVTPAQLALAWILRQNNVASAITGASKPSQVAENAAASQFALSDEVSERVEQILASS